MAGRLLTEEIVDQIYVALRDPGAEGLVLRRIRAMNSVQLYDAAEKLGATPALLGFLGSWGDTLSDREILECLREWNAESKSAAE